MSGTRCNIDRCNNSLVATKKLNQNISYHRFPKDEKIRDIWTQRCKRDGKWNDKCCFICSIHFKETDYEKYFQSEFLKKIQCHRSNCPTLRKVSIQVEN